MSPPEQDQPKENYIPPAATSPSTTVEPTPTTDRTTTTEALAEERELVSTLLYMDAFPNQSPERPKVAAGDAPSYLGLDGKPITNLDTVDPNKPILAESINPNGQKEILAYSSKADLTAGKPAARLVLEVSNQDGLTVEKGTIYRGNTGEVLTTRAITQDSKSFDLTFQVEANGETQKVVFDGNGLPKKFELTKDGRTVQFKFDDYGNVIDCSDSQNPDQPIKEPFRDMFLKAAKQSLDELRTAQGLPAPWAGENPVAVSGNGNGAKLADGNGVDTDIPSPPRPQGPPDSPLTAPLRTEIPAPLRPEGKPGTGTNPAELSFTAPKPEAKKVEAAAVEPKAPPLEAKVAPKPLDDLEKKQVTKAIEDLGSSDFRTREQAEATLSKFGDRALKRMTAELKNTTDAHVQRKLGELVDRAIRPHLAVPWESGYSNLTPPITPDQLRNLDDRLKLADLYASDPERRNSKKAELKALPETLGVAINKTTIDARLAAVDNAGPSASSIRIDAAEILTNNGDKANAQKYLLDAMGKDPTVVTDAKFIRAAVASGAATDAAFVESFKAQGGDIKVLERLNRPQQAKPGESTVALWDKFGLGTADTLYRIPPMEPQDRMAEYAKLKGDPNQAQKRLDLLADHYLAARNDQQRQQALDLLAKESEGGNPTALEYARILPLRAYAEAADRMLGNKPPKFPDSATRLAEIERQMKELPAHRKNPMDVPDLLVEHYRMATSPQERAEALALLRQEVQMGNLSAQFTLNGMSRLDAVLNIADGLNTQRREPWNFKAAQDKIDAATKQLAFHDHFDQARENVTPVNFLDLLTRSPQTGEREAATRKGDTPAAPAAPGPIPKAHELFRQVLGQSDADREKTLRQLDALVSKYRGLELGKDYKDASDLAKTVFASQDILYGLGDTDTTVKGLLALGEQSPQNARSREFLTDLAKTGDAGAKLAAAIEKKDGVTAAQLFKDNPDLVKTVGKVAKTFVDVKEPVSFLKGVDVLQPLGLMQQYGNGRFEASQFDVQTRKAGEDAVSKYLARDTIAKPARDALLKALPESDTPFKLGAENADLRKLLTDASQKNALTPKVKEFADTLLGDGELTAEQVKELRRELKLAGDARRDSALTELYNAAGARAPYSGMDLQYTFNSLQSIESARNVHSATKQALETLGKEDSTPQAKREAMDEVVRQLKFFESLATNNGLNQLAQGFYQKFGGKEAFEQLYKDIEGGGPGAKAALERIYKDLPDGEETANEFRALRIVRNAGPESTPEYFKQVAAELGREVDASKLESTQTNKAAADWQSWALANEQVSTLTKSAAENNPEASKEAVKKLVEQAKEGNPYAKTALAAVIAGDTNKVAEFLAAYPGSNGKPTYVPNLTGLDASSRLAVTRLAAHGLHDVVTKQLADFRAANGNDAKPDSLLSAQEVMAVALGLAKVRQGELGTASEDRNRDVFELLLSKATYDVSDKGQGDLMTGLFAAMQTDRSSTRDVADYYNNLLGNPKLADHLPKLQELAISGNQAAMRVMAALTAGKGDLNRTVNPIEKTGQKDGKDIYSETNSISKRARATLELAAASGPEARAEVVEALMHVNRKTHDSKELLATMGAIATKLGDRPADVALRGAVLEDLRRGFEKSADKMAKREWQLPHEINQFDEIEYKSALSGMVAMAPHWTVEEGATFTNRLTPDVVQSLEKIGSDLNPVVAKEILDRVSERVKKVMEGGKDNAFHWTDQVAELTANLKVMAGLGKYASADQVKLLASFGGDSHWKVDGKPGAEVLKARFPQLTDDQIKDIQAQAGRGLLNVLARSSGEPRDAAYKAFRNLPWPIRTADGTGWVESHKSRELTENLVKYFEGNPFKLELAGEIARIVDDAHLPKPAAALLAELKIGSTDPAQIGSGFTVWDKSSQIVKNYTKNGENGEDVLRRVIANAAMVNTLPGIERARAMGWDKLSSDDKKALGWFDTPEKGNYQHLGFLSLPSHEQARILEQRAKGVNLSDAQWADLERKGQERWSRMSDSEKEAFRWSGVQSVDVTKVIGQMYGNKLQVPESLNRMLLDKGLVTTVEGLRASHDQAALDAKRRAADAVKDRDNTMEDLVKKTKAGANFGNQLVGFLTLDNGRDQELNGEQGRLLGMMDVHSNRIKAEEAKKATEERKSAELQVAADTNRHRILVDSGEQVEADKLALKMWKDHGPALAIIAPGVWESLNVSTDGGLQGASALKRMEQRGLAHFSIVPGYNSGREGFRGALGLAEAINHGEKPPLQRSDSAAH